MTTALPNSFCRKDTSDQSQESSAFYIVYGILSSVAIILNSTLLYIIYFPRHSRHQVTIHSLVKLLIILDLSSGCLLPLDLFVVRFYSHDIEILFDFFYAIRDGLLSCHAILLLLLSVDRTLSIVWPMRQQRINRIIKTLLLGLIGIVSLLYIVRLTIFQLNIGCKLMIKLDTIFVFTIGIIAVVILSLSVLFYSVLFYLIFNFLNRKPISEFNRMRLKYTFRFTIVFSFATFLLIVSFLPLFLRNTGMIEWPGYILFYSFYLHCLFDPVMLIFSKKTLRNRMKWILTCGKSRLRTRTLTFLGKKNTRHGSRF